MTIAYRYYEKEDLMFTIEKELPIPEERVKKIFHIITKKYGIKAEIYHQKNYRGRSCCQAICEINKKTNKKRIIRGYIIRISSTEPSLLLIIHEISHAIQSERDLSQKTRKHFHNKELTKIVEEVTIFCRKKSFYKKLLQERKNRKKLLKKCCLQWQWDLKKQKVKNKMTDEKISFICIRSAELRKGKSTTELSQSDAMKMAWQELKKQKVKI